MAACIELRGIAKSYAPGRPVLQPLNLEIAAGEIFFLLGASGCGKSTLLRILAGLLTPDCGRIFFDGRDITALPPEKRCAAMVFQNYALWPHMTVFENVAFGLQARREPAEAIRRTVREMLRVVQLEGFEDRKVPQLSGGQQQRVALARALAVRPKLLLLDEPLSNLDAKLRDEMRLEIRRIIREQELTALYVTHDRHEALSIGDRIAVMNGGRIEQVGTPEDVYQRPATRFVAGFLGKANLLECRILDRSGGRTMVDTRLGCLAAAGGTDLPVGAPALLLVRPEGLRFAAGEEENTFEAHCLGRMFLGEEAEYSFDSAAGPLALVESPPRRRDAAGATVRLVAPPEQLTVLPPEERDER